MAYLLMFRNCKLVFQSTITNHYHFFQSEVFESQNTESIGSLWVGLLRFYAVQFDQAKFVISLRQRKKMSREEKKWTSKRLAMEGQY